VRQQLRDEADELVENLGDEVEHDDKVRLKRSLQSTIRPFLDAPQQAGAALADEQKSAVVFESLRRALPAVLHPVLTDLQSICEEERQLIRQRRIYHWLHVWLLVHVPLSIVLLVLGGVHAIVALRY
jgi:5-formyltetrahydrofolate cyclo-ligase